MPNKPGYYDHLDFNSPLTDGNADALVTRLAATAPATIVDIGCGWAELLLRLLAACPAAYGHGIDRDETLIARAGANATQRGLDKKATFSNEVGDPQPADLVLCIGSDHIFGSAADALVALRPWVNPGGTLLFGTGIWEQPPSAELSDDFGELPNLPEVVSQATAAGWQVRDLRTATLEDWDDFEFRYAADWELAATHAETAEEAAEARQTFDDYIAAYIARRGVLGFAYLTLGQVT